MKVYRCDNGFAVVDVLAESPEAAAWIYANDDAVERLETEWAEVWVWIPGEDRDNADRLTVTLDPIVPDCVGDIEHDWQTPHDILGGAKDNPGVMSNGGGVITKDVCVRCGCLFETNTWAQRSDTGEQGLRSQRYEPARYQDEIRALPCHARFLLLHESTLDREATVDAIRERLECDTATVDSRGEVWIGDEEGGRWLDDDELVELARYVGFSASVSIPTRVIPEGW